MWKEVGGDKERIRPFIQVLCWGNQRDIKVVGLPPCTQVSSIQSNKRWEGPPMYHWVFGINGDLVYMGDLEYTIPGKKQAHCYNTSFGSLL